MVPAQFDEKKKGDTYKEYMSPFSGDIRDPITEPC
jgi:hypothetical protein